MFSVWLLLSRSPQPPLSKPPPFLVQISIYSAALPASALAFPVFAQQSSQRDLFRMKGWLCCSSASWRQGIHMLMDLSTPQQCLVPISCPVRSYWEKEWNHWIPFSFQSTPGDLIHFSSLAFFVFLPQFIIPAKTFLLRTTWHFAYPIPIFLLPTLSNFSHLRKSILWCVWRNLATKGRSTLPFLTVKSNWIPTVLALPHK